ncbi:MAG TPA: class I adenylate-forming enzyme family protein, partial [Mycobacteriales bacterium]|nr:class I adenylate-forming enzyme family protein [Mycobacteriales bacterium]
MHRGLERAAERHPHRVALRFEDTDWTWEQLDLASNAFARHLRGSVKRGDRVVVMSGNRPEFVIAVNAISKIGAATVLVSPAWKHLEVDHALAITGARCAVTDEASYPMLKARLGQQQVTNLDDEPALDAILRRDSSPLGIQPPTPEEEAVLVFSSGTTGLPKAVRHTHHSMGHGIDHWVASLGLTREDRFQIATPPSHILGLLNFLTAAAAGATVRLHRRFDLDELLRRIQDERMTLEMAVAPIALAMAGHPSIEDYDLSSLRYIMWGATPVTVSVAETVTRRTGVRWLPAYGATELPVLACNPIEGARLDTVGRAAPGVCLRTASLEDGKPLPPGKIGEIQARSPSLMAGYLPDGADAGAVVDGWYRTGDVGWIEPEGWVHLTDRAKEMIKVKGFQVAPAEIEAVLHGHPSVRDCAVFGVPDPAAGELPVAAVLIDPDHPTSPDELRSLVAESLATYKQLRDVVIVEDIPRLPSGKVLRRVLQ